jgi:hypothetical protein
VDLNPEKLLLWNELNAQLKDALSTLRAALSERHQNVQQKKTPQDVSRAALEGRNGHDQSHARIGKGEPH